MVLTGWMVDPVLVPGDGTFGRWPAWVAGVEPHKGFFERHVYLGKKYVPHLSASQLAAL